MEIIVPIDITGEEKDILAIFSRRQFILTFPTAVGSLIFLLWGYIPFLSPFTSFILRFILFLIIMAISIALAYVKLHKYEQYLSEYVMTQWKFYKSQKTYTYF